jgi:uncharacterized protein (DUF169 family)
VTFAGPSKTGSTCAKEKVSVCQALRKASHGEAVAITAETCGCPGELVSLGLGQASPQNKKRLVEFLTRKKKDCCSRMVMHRGQQTVIPPLGVASQVIFAPLSEATALPDVVVFIGRPGSLHHLITCAGYWEGGSIEPDFGARRLESIEPQIDEPGAVIHA